MPIKAPPLPESEHMRARRTSGRPTKYKRKFCEEVTELAKTGASMAEICSHFDISRQTIDNWANKHPEFLEALTRAKIHAQAWWEAIGRQGLVANKFNGKIWEVSMRARFREDYTERKELTGADGGAIQTELIEGKVNELEGIIEGIITSDDRQPAQIGFGGGGSEAGAGITIEVDSDGATGADTA